MLPDPPLPKPLSVNSQNHGTLSYLPHLLQTSHFNHTLLELLINPSSCTWNIASTMLTALNNINNKARLQTWWMPQDAKSPSETDTHAPTTVTTDHTNTHTTTTNNNSMDAGHWLGESDIKTTERSRCCNKLEHVMENEAVSQKIRVSLLYHKHAWSKMASSSIPQ